MPDGGMPVCRAGVLNLPNIVTLGRLCAVPVAVWLVLRQHMAAATGLFVLAGLSDALDGWLARRSGGSALGAMLDPLADKALVISLLVTLAVTGVLPAWLAVLVLARDGVIVLGVLVLWRRRGRMRIAPVFVGKLNTALQLGLIGAALLLAANGVSMPPLLTALVWLVAGTTLLSGGAYVRQALR